LAKGVHTEGRQEGKLQSVVQIEFMKEKDVFLVSPHAKKKKKKNTQKLGIMHRL
jgi:hypothetical protein